MAKRWHRVQRGAAHRWPLCGHVVVGGVHLHLGADLLARIPARRPSLYPLFCRAHLVQRWHAHDGARRKHGAAHPRLGNHGPVFVHAHRPLVGRRSQQPRGTQGVLDCASRRHWLAGRHRNHLLRRQRVCPGVRKQRFQHCRNQRVGAQRHGCLTHCAALGLGRVIHCLHRQERSVPAPHVVARRNGRPHASELAVALQHDGRRRRVLGGPPLPAVPHRARHQRGRAAIQPHRRDWWHHHHHRGGSGLRADRHQKGVGLLNSEPARVHDDGPRRRRLYACRVPHLHSCVL
ncbi:unannotated protein [freshwater metagenome]|uniref:Unannotated protein n=1 Tax=freshwater metagenome TaxID=449393 RepID=A0A6J6PK55_9ZZZZ